MSAIHELRKACQCLYVAAKAEAVIKGYLATLGACSEAFDALQYYKGTGDAQFHKAYKLLKTVRDTQLRYPLQGTPRVITPGSTVKSTEEQL